MTIDHIIKTLEEKGISLDKEQKERLEKGYEFGEKALKDTERLTGENVFSGHCIPSAELFVEYIEDIASVENLNVDNVVDSVVALLNHHVTVKGYKNNESENTTYSRKNIKKVIGENAEFKMFAMNYRNGDGGKALALTLANEGEGDRYIGSMLLANCIDNLRTANLISEEKKGGIETVEKRYEAYIKLAEEKGYKTYSSIINNGLEELQIIEKGNKALEKAKKAVTLPFL